MKEDSIIIIFLCDTLYCKYFFVEYNSVSSHLYCVHCVCVCVDSLWYM